MEISKQTSFLREHIKCPICFEEFSQIHLPLIIPCGHTICSICVENIKKMTEEDYDQDEYRSDLDQEEEYDISLDTDENQDVDESENEDSHSEGSHDEDSEDEEEEEEEDEDEDEYGNETNSVESESIEPAPLENIIPKAHENKKTKKIRFKCSICRKKMKIMESEIIQNKSIMNIIESYQNPPQDGKKEASKNNNKKIFCKLCRYVDLESNHLVKFSSHTNSVIDLQSDIFLKQLKTYFSGQETEDKANTYRLNIPENPEVKKSLSNFFDYVCDQDNISAHSNDYFKNYFKVNSKASYIKYKSFKKLTKLYTEFEKVAQEIENSNKNEESLVSLKRKAENILTNSEKLVQKYYKIINIYYSNYNLILGETENSKLTKSDNQDIEETKLRKIHLNKIIEKLFYDKCLKILKDGFFQTYFNKIFTSERRYAVCSSNSDNKIYIYDLRLENELELHYKNVFASMEGEYDEEEFENLFSDFLEIDEEGRNIFILGERNKDSQKFYNYDINMHELKRQEDLPIKYGSFDRIYFNRKLFIIGGATTDSSPLPECFYFDMISENWNEMPSLKIQRFNKSVAYNYGKLYVFGGHSLENEVSINKFEILNLPVSETSDWQTITIKNFNIISASYLYSFQSENIFVILGGQDSNEDGEKKGYFIDFSLNEVIEEFKIKNEMINSYSTCSSLRGVLIGSPLGDGYFTKMNLRNNFKKLKTII